VIISEVLGDSVPGGNRDPMGAMKEGRGSGLHDEAWDVIDYTVSAFA